MRVEMSGLSFGCVQVSGSSGAALGIEWLELS